MNGHRLELADVMLGTGRLDCNPPDIGEGAEGVLIITIDDVHDMQAIRISRQVLPGDKYIEFDFN